MDGRPRAEHRFEDISTRLTFSIASKIQKITEFYEIKFDRMVGMMVAAGDNNMTTNPARVQVANKLGPEYKVAIERALATANIPTKQWCLNHGKYCDIFPSVRNDDTIYMFITGVDCTPWTERGARLKWMKTGATLSCLVFAKVIVF